HQSVPVVGTLPDPQTVEQLSVAPKFRSQALAETPEGVLAPEHLRGLHIRVVRQQKAGLIPQSGQRGIPSVVGEVAVHLLVHGDVRLDTLQEVGNDLGRVRLMSYEEELQQIPAGGLHLTGQVEEPSLRLKEVILEDGVQLVWRIPAPSIITGWQP